MCVKVEMKNEINPTEQVVGSQDSRGGDQFNIGSYFQQRPSCTAWCVNQNKTPNFSEEFLEHQKEWAILDEMYNDLSFAEMNTLMEMARRYSDSHDEEYGSYQLWMMLGLKHKLDELYEDMLGVEGRSLNFLLVTWGYCLWSN